MLWPLAALVLIAAVGCTLVVFTLPEEVAEWQRPPPAVENCPEESPLIRRRTEPAWEMV